MDYTGHKELDTTERLSLSPFAQFSSVAVLCLTPCDPMNHTVRGILQARILESGSLSLLQGIFPTQGSNPGLLH